MEDEICLTKNQLRSILNQAQLLSEGSEGKCFLFKKDTVFKYFNLCEYPEFLDEYTSTYNKKMILQFKDLSIPHFIFGKKIVYVDGIIVGYIMPLALGQELSKVNLLKEPYSKILGATKEGIDDIKILSSKHIITEDLYETNISYDSKNFYFFDTLWYSFSDIDSSSIFKHNMESFSNSLYRKIVLSEIRKFVLSNKNLKDYSNDPQLLYNPILFLNMLKEELNSYCGKNIRCFETANKMLKKR